MGAMAPIQMDSVGAALNCNYRKFFIVFEKLKKTTQSRRDINIAVVQVLQHF